MNKKIFMHFKGDEEFVSRIQDLALKANRTRNIVFTPFLSIHEQDICKKVIRDCFIYEDGGYLQAELKRFAFSAEKLDNIAFPIVCLFTKYNEKYHQINHRDVLGSIMNLGINRNVSGDILVQGSAIYMFVNKDMETYFRQNLKKIKNLSIDLLEYNDAIEKVDRIEYRQVTISSFRLDVMVASICNLSRDKAKRLIQANLVKVNQVILEECSHLCNNNSTISIRGYGRFIVSDLEKTTKKNRLLVQIGKYL